MKKYLFLFLALMSFMGLFANSLKECNDDDFLKDKNYNHKISLKKEYTCVKLLFSNPKFVFSKSNDIVSWNIDNLKKEGVFDFGGNLNSFSINKGGSASARNGYVVKYGTKNGKYAFELYKDGKFIKNLKTIW